MLYDIEGHKLLSGRAATMDSEELEVYGLVAERMLGLVAPALEGEDGEVATSAVALQVSLVAAMGVEIWYLKSESRGARSVTYRDDGEVPIHPLAARLLETLPTTAVVVSSEWDAANWPTVTTLRGGADSLPPAGWLVLTPYGDVRPEG